MKSVNLFSERSLELFPGILLQGFAGEKLMVSHLVFEAGAIAPIHSHPHEQITIMLKGELEFECGGETRILRAGDTVSVPGNVAHGGKALQAAEALEFFTPVRDDLMARLQAQIER